MKRRKNIGAKLFFPMNKQLSGGQRAGAGLLAGAVAGLVMTLVMLLLAWLANLATPLVILGDRLSVFIPPGPFLAIMGRVGGYTHLKELGVGSTIAGQIIIGALGGLFYSLTVARRGNSRLLSLGTFFLLPFLASVALLWPQLGTSYQGWPILSATIITCLGLAISFLAFECTLVLGFRFLTQPSVSPHDLAYSPRIGRRALVLGALGLLVAGGGAAVIRRLFAVATFSYDGTQYKGREVQGITPNDKFYCVTKNVIDPRVNQSLWRLEVTGLVQHRQTYHFARLRSLPAVNQETTLMCISNGLDAGLMSNAVWRGVPMRQLLHAAGPLPGAAKVRLHGVDNYTDTFPLVKAMEPTTLVAYEMNGERLPDRHGFPARVVVPGYFGEKNVKWLTRIELTGPDAEGFYEKQGWGPNFLIPTRSRIDQPDDFAWFSLTKSSGSIPLRGVAFAGDRGVARVEVSLDDGQSWQDAKIDYPGTRLTWVLWSFDWRPAIPAEYKLTVRATDGNGAVQQLEKDRGQFSGTTGFHTITVYLAA
jgi:DMSO/TMAO reductase YedYZ molybdopterin-dependent catalytic subunit